MQVKWTHQALLNLDAAVEYIAKDNPTAAQNTAQQIWTASQLLAAQPGLGRPGRVANTRELIIPGLPYILPYSERTGEIYILRVIHASMRWPEGA